MITREDLIRVGTRQLSELGSKVAIDPLAAMTAIADGLGLNTPPRPGSALFVRQTRWVPPEVAARFDVVIVGGRIESSWRRGRIAKTNRDESWYAAVRGMGTAIAIFDWMIAPGLWRPGLEEAVDFAASVDAAAFLLNVEPANKAERHTGRDWRGKGAELAAYAGSARELCDARGLELWSSSWADPPRSFPLRELVHLTHVDIPQPYEVHGRAGPEYVASVLAEYRAAGSREQILGRGAHELDAGDDDSWRTPAQILSHRASTPRGMGEAWWLPAGDLAARPEVVDAMLLRPLPAHRADPF